MILKKSRANPDDRVIAAAEKPFLVAEFGLNHNRDIELVKRMVEAARQSGIDAVKLQSYTTKYFIHRAFENVRALYDIFASLEIDMDFHSKVRDLTYANGMAFISTPLTLDWVENLAELDVPAFKIASGDVNNWPLLQAVTAHKKPVLISTGAASEKEVAAMITFLEKQNSEYAVLHCVSLYPTPLEKANIARMQKLATLVPPHKHVPIGFSDHTLGVEAAFAAVAAGAQIIEKHFTLDKNLPGPDQKMSFSPKEMKHLREQIDLAFEIRGVPQNADCHSEETQSDYYGKRSLYTFEGEVRAMRPRHKDYPIP